jgi:hypothetical protein
MMGSYRLQVASVKRDLKLIYMKKLVTFLICFIGSAAFAQKEIKPTSEFTISGEVKAAVKITFDDLKKYKSQSIADVIITNHLGEKKSEAKGLKGILLKSVVEKAEINAESPKVLSEYYFVCKANDGYKVVFSWNELFNTTVGESAYIITEKEGKGLDKMTDSILLLSPNDFKTGRRHLKALASIEVRRAN